MDKNNRVLIFSSLGLIFLSSLHAYVFPFAVDWDGVTGILILAGMAAGIGFFLPQKIAHYLFTPVLVAALFSFFELLSELDPHNGSKGFGIIYFVTCIPTAYVGTLFGLLIRRFTNRAR